jgi:hypothetical protein
MPPAPQPKFSEWCLAFRWWPEVKSLFLMTASSAFASEPLRCRPPNGITLSSIPDQTRRKVSSARACHELTALKVEGKAGQHQAGKGDKMQAGQGGGQPLVIAGQPPKASHPGEGPLDDPAARQEHKAPLGLGQFDHLQLHAVRGGGRRRRRARVALVDIGHLDMLADDLLNGLDQLAHLGPVSGIGRRDPQGQQLAQGVDRCIDLTVPASFSPS